MNEPVDLRVTKSNELIQAGYRLSLNEQRLILTAIAQIDSRKPIKQDCYYQIKAEEFAKHFGMDVRHAYEALKEASARLYERDVRIYDRKNKIREKLRWVFHIKYHDGEGFVDIGFLPKIIPYLSLLNKEFTSYYLHHVSKLNSSYAIRIYEMLKQYISVGSRIITIEQFRNRLELTDLYPRFFDLKKRIIAPAVKEINTYTDIFISWEPVRKGRAIKALYFNINENTQGKLELN